MTNTKRNWIWLPCLVASTGALAGAATPDASLLDLSLEELMSIEVGTASLYGATLADSAAWVTVLNERDWRKTGARRTLDALASQPATLVLPLVAGGDMLAIRGYARTTSHRGVAFLWDGVPLTDLVRGGTSVNTPNINLFSLSSIEYAQGPGSALHGSDAFLGVVGLNSFTPQTEGATELLAGTNGYYQAGIRDGVDLGERHRLGLALAANGQANQHESYTLFNREGTDSLQSEWAKRYDTGTAVVHLSSDEQQDTTYQLSYYRHHYDASGYPGVGELYFPAESEGGIASDLEMGRLNLRHRFDDQRSIEVRGYYWDLTSETSVNLALSGGAILAEQIQAYDQYRYGGQIIYRDYLAALRTRWALSAGYDKAGIYDSNTRIQANTGVILLDGPDNLDGAHRDIDSGVFEANTELLADRLFWIWGARQDDYSDFGKQVSPRTGLILRPYEGHSIKLTYGEAFRAPTASEMLGSSSLTAPNPNLKPETIRNTELIWLYQNGHNTTQISVFEGRWNNGIVTVVDDNGVTRYENQARNTNQGLAAGHSSRWQNWLFDVGGSWVESRNKTQDYYYDAFPRYIFNLGLGYNASTINTDVYLLQRFMFDMDAEVVGREYTSSGTLPTFWRTDLTATWHAQPQLDVMLVIQNLFDRENYLPATTNRGGVEGENFAINAGMRYRFE